MSRRLLKPSILLVTIALSSLLGFGLIIRQASAVSPDANARNVNFYFHYQATPVFVGGTMSHYLMNTTARFQATNNSVTKSISQPRIEVDFFSYPAFAGSVTFNGTWQIIIWANASALKPTVWNTEYQEVSPGGSVVWDSGLLAPSVVGGPAGHDGYLDVPIYAYNLSDANLAHNFSAGNSVRVAVSANPGSTVTAELWYDSQSFPSQAIFPSYPIGSPSEIWTEDSTGFVTSSFLATAGLKVIVNANVTDPFGGYDVNATNLGTRDTMATVTVTAPDTTVIVNAQRMTLLTGGLTSLSNILQYNVTLTAGMPGAYTVLVTSTDNSGNLEQLSFTFTLGQTYKLGVYIVDGQNRPLPGAVLTIWSGNFQVFSQVASSSGTVNGTLVSGSYTMKVGWEGVTVYEAPFSFVTDTNLSVKAAVYDVSIIVADDTGAPLSGAVVSIIHPNGTVFAQLVTTGTDGSISLPRAPAGNWSFTVLWKTVDVFTGVVQLSSSGPYTIKTQVYQLAVTVDDNTGHPVQGAYVVLYNSYGVVYDFKATDSSGSVTLKVPVGTYTVEALYSTTYMFTPVTSSVNKTSVAVNSSGSLTLTLASYPPPLIQTSFFLVVITAIVGVAVAVVATYFIVKKRRPGTGPAQSRLTSNEGVLSN
jgi:hypothetical protein